MLGTGLDPRGIAPQGLEPIERSLLLDEDVHDEIDEVEQHPVARAPPFDMIRAPAVVLCETRLDGVGDGHDLSLAGAVADDEVIGDVAQSAKIEYDDVFGLLVLRSFDAVGEFRGQRDSSCRYSRCR